MKPKHLSLLILLTLSGFFLYAQPAQDGGPDQGRPIHNPGELPLRRITLLSSGVAYFEHQGEIASPSGAVDIILPFDLGAVNDALMSLIIIDPASSSPSVRYATANSLQRNLQSLNIDLSWIRGIGDILNSLAGAELEVTLRDTQELILGRIIGVEHRPTAARPAVELWLTLFTAQGIRIMTIEDISLFNFTDSAINDDFRRGLDLVLASRNMNTQNLIVSLDGGSPGRAGGSLVSRNVSISYVIPAPIWKVSYRLDLSGDMPLLQGWAIIDNDSDIDWMNVELSLLT